MVTKHHLSPCSLGTLASRSQGTDPGWEPCSRGYILRPAKPSRLPSAFAGLRAPRHGAKVCIWCQEEQAAAASPLKRTENQKASSGQSPSYLHIHLRSRPWCGATFLASPGQKWRHEVWTCRLWLSFLSLSSRASSLSICCRPDRSCVCDDRSCVRPDRSCLLPRVRFFWGRLEMLGLTSKKDPTKRNLLMFETVGKGASKCSKYESFWTYQQIHSLKLTAKATEKWWKGKDPASLWGKRPMFNLVGAQPYPVVGQMFIRFPLLPISSSFSRENDHSHFIITTAQSIFF